MSISAIIAENIFWICLVIFLVMRVPLLVRARREPIRTSRRDMMDWIVLRIAETGLGVLPMIYVIAKFPAFATYPFFPPFAVLGTAVFALGLWFIHRAQHDLGRSFSGHLEIRREHELVTAGIYKSVRHPMYLGFLLWAVAQVLLLPNWIAGPAGLVGWTVLFASRVVNEENMMIQEFGGQYRDYAERTSRLIPRVF
jgi:protein-S-isoprenylcysteine O-methyltransferase Ste14